MARDQGLTSPLRGTLVADSYPPANDNPISLTDLAKASGFDEDTLLGRLAGILSRREENNGEPE